MPNVRQMIHLFIAKKLIPAPTPLSVITDPLVQGKNVSLIRYGDGEWAAMLGYDGGNCDGHSYGGGLGDALLDTVRKPVNALYGMQRFAVKNMGRFINGLITKEKISIPWINAEVLQQANMEGELYPLIKILRHRECVVIGPNHIREAVADLFNPAHFIEIPAKNCFEARDSIEKEILLYGEGKSGVIYLFSASMAANVMIHNLFPILGENNSLLDVGSLWDVYGGVKSRSIFSEQDWSEIIQKNRGIIR